LKARILVIYRFGLSGRMIEHLLQNDDRQNTCYRMMIDRTPATEG